MLKKLQFINTVENSYANYNNEGLALKLGEYIYYKSYLNNDVFEDEGLIGLNSPKSVLKEAFSAGIIQDEKLWMNMLMDRNSISHMYNESNAIEICENIKEQYAEAFEKLKENIIERIGYMGEK
ncbi:Nucleotidyltransferase substrate binding protein like protein [Clostridium liquoris]|uniref:Nucleotidyltransferase substrate binding protein like protein n=1 Tax=Clostridium liquoris TaxID=1289519 RepID=A0A2T0B132_9CLOT|nr:HI0074 family nucleotidyltransferase substrate-binding subunit [Clostridium liquoris]PRR77321.1 Nucleotidyltransferase substrate binding protein like protein [Clostridium liquoris]